MDTLLAFIVVFGTIVFFHEMGHFLMAKAMGVKIYEFSLGFGPPLLRLRRNGTAYAIRILPLGGFVKLAGMDEPLEGGRSKPERSPKLPQQIYLAAHGHHRRRPLMNFVLATLLFIAYFSLIHVFPPIVTNVLPNSPAVRREFSRGQDPSHQRGNYYRSWPSDQDHPAQCQPASYLAYRAGRGDDGPVSRTQ